MLEGPCANTRPHHTRNRGNRGQLEGGCGFWPMPKVTGKSGSVRTGLGGEDQKRVMSPEGLSAWGPSDFQAPPSTSRLESCWAGVGVRARARQAIDDWDRSA